MTRLLRLLGLVMGAKPAPEPLQHQMRGRYWVHLTSTGNIVDVLVFGEWVSYADLPPEVLAEVSGNVLTPPGR